MAKVYKATTLGFLIGLTLVGCASTRLESQQIRSNTNNTEEFEVLLDNLSLMSIRLEQLEGLYNDAKLSSSLVPFSEVFSEGQEAYLNKDHARTVTLFDPLSRDPVNFNEPLFPAAIYYLADAHFRLKNFDLSRLYFERLAKLPKHEYMGSALEKLALIAKERKDWAPLQPFLAQIQDLPSLSPIAQYALGYGFHQLEELEKALPLYAGVPENSEWYSRARYARAVALIALKRQSEAREELNALLSRETPTEIDAAVQSWARLSSARLHFEMDSLEDATRDYQAIERESPHFAESIHELAQTQVRYAEKQTDIGQRRKAFERALATLELLFILEEEEQTIAEALMLKASIFIRLGKIDDAKLTLAYLLERFDPLTSYMQDLPQRIATLTNYYDLLSPGFKSDSLELVPMVSEYLAGGQKLQRGRVLIGDLRELYRAIDYLRLKSETLGQKLRIDPKGYFLPSGQRAYEQVDELEEAFSKSSNQLIKISSAIVRPLLNADERLELDQLLNELETTYTEFSILKGSERAFIKSLGRQVDQETFAMTKTPQERISRDVAQTRARYEVTLRNLQQFVRTYYKRLAQKPGSGSRSESQIGEKLQELREKRLNLNDALKRNQDYQRAVVDGAVEGSWSRQAELKQLILLTEHFETHPLLLRPQTRDWLTEKLTQRRSFLDRAETKQGTLRPAGEIRDGANLMLLSLRLLESELNQSYLETYNLERTVQMTLSNDGRLSGVSLALALERSGKLLTRLRARSKNLEVKIRRHIDARLSEMRLNLQQGLNQLRNQSAALNLAEAKTRQLVDVLAIDALADLRSYLDELLVRTEVAQLDILWEEKVERVREIDDLLSQQREAVRDVERSFKHLVEP